MDVSQQTSLLSKKKKNYGIIIWCQKRSWKEVGNLQLWWILDFLYSLILLHALDRLWLCPWCLWQQAWQWGGVSVLVLQGRLHWEILWQDLQELWPQWAVPVLPPARCLQPQWHSKVSLCGTFRAHCHYRAATPVAVCGCVLGAQHGLSDSANLLDINLACSRDCSTCVPFVFILLRCICMDGYEGDGFSCQPIDLCSQPERGGCSQNVSGLRLKSERQLLSIRTGIQGSWDCYTFLC